MGRRAFFVIKAHFSRVTIVLLDQITSVNSVRRLLERIPRSALSMMFDRVSKNTVDQTSLQEKKGTVALVSQSGAIEIIVSNLLRTDNLGISKLISFDDRTDLDESKLLDVANDRETKVILLYIESIQQGRSLMNVARSITGKKPIVVFKGGKIGIAANTVMSHTGFLAGRYEIWRAAFVQSGMMEVNRIEDMLDFANALSLQKPANGCRIGIITNGGGAGIACADECLRLGLEIPRLPEVVQQKLKARLSSFSETGNPVDVTVTGNAKDYYTAFKVLIDSEYVDAVIMMLYPTPILIIEKLFNLIAENIENPSKPIVCSTSGNSSFINSVKYFTRNKIPLYLLPESAAIGASALVRYGTIKKDSGTRSQSPEKI